MLIFEHSRTGRRAYGQAPKALGDTSALPENLRRARRPLLPEVSELQAVRQQLASDLGHVSGTMTSVRQGVPT